MKTTWIRSCISLVLWIASESPAVEPFQWTLSSSGTDPYVNSGELPSGQPSSIYLWVACMSEGERWSAAAMGIDAQVPGLFVFGFTPMNGVLSVGTFPDLLLAVGGCPPTPFLAGVLTCFAPEPVTGQFCLVPSSGGDLLTVDCDVNPGIHPIQATGFGVGSPPTCDDGPCNVGHSWGACCLPDGTCIIANSYEECIKLGGRHQGYPSACNPGACCFPDGTCMEVYDHPGCGVCEALGGEYQGIFTKYGATDCGATPRARSSWGRIKGGYR